jgi:hypothetical protein
MAEIYNEPTESDNCERIVAKWLRHFGGEDVPQRKRRFVEMDVHPAGMAQPFRYTATRALFRVSTHHRYPNARKYPASSTAFGQ